MSTGANISRRWCRRGFALAALITILTAASTQLKADTGICGGQMITLPFTDVPSSNAFFCSIAEAYFSALTNGTTSTTYSPSEAVTRGQLAAFVTRTLDQSLKRGSNRAALGQWWTTTPHYDIDLGTTALGSNSPRLVQSDGKDVWVANSVSGDVSRVRASDGLLLETWTGATNAWAPLVAMGRVFITGQNFPNGTLYMIDPSKPPGAVTTVAANLGGSPYQLAFDGSRIWTANLNGSVSIITPGASLPWAVTTVPISSSNPIGILYDGANIWITDLEANALRKLDTNGNVIQTVTVGSDPHFPVFDGTNIWVPNLTHDTITVVRASTGAVLATLSGGGLGLGGVINAAFDGERILVTGINGRVSLWKAADFRLLGSSSTGAQTSAQGVCSDGVSFWVVLIDSNSFAGTLARF